MKKAIMLFAAAIMLPVLCQAQDFERKLKLSIGSNKEETLPVEVIDSHNFIVVDGSDVAWQKVFVSDIDNIQDLQDQFFWKGFHNCRILDDLTMVCDYIWRGWIPVQKYGYKRGKMPVFLLNIDKFTARVVVQVRNGRYRVTFDNIYTFGRLSGPGLESGYFDFLIDERTGGLRDEALLDVALDVLDRMFTEAVDFSKPGYLSPNF